MSLDREGCRDLVLAVFRLAVCDYLGQRYGYDGPVSYQRLRASGCATSSSAEVFLTDPWASHLADMAGFSAATVWRESLGLVRTPELGRR